MDLHKEIKSAGDSLGNMAEEKDAEITFLPTDTSEIHLHVELLL